MESWQTKLERVIPKLVAYLKLCIFFQKMDATEGSDKVSLEFSSPWTKLKLKNVLACMTKILRLN
jgi:hypothetical protein